MVIAPGDSQPQVNVERPLMASSHLKLQGAEHAVDLDRGSIVFVQTATVVLRYAGFTI